MTRLHLKLCKCGLCCFSVHKMCPFFRFMSLLGQRSRHNATREDPQGERIHFRVDQTIGGWLHSLLEVGWNVSTNLTKMYSALHSYLNTASLHSKRKYEDVCAENGLILQAVPQMLDVRFRVIVRLAKWMEDDNRCIYLFIKQLEESLRAEPRSLYKGDLRGRSCFSQ